jgi:hypothetical protein
MDPDTRPNLHRQNRGEISASPSCYERFTFDWSGSWVDGTCTCVSRDRKLAMELDAFSGACPTQRSLRKGGSSWALTPVACV